MSKNIIKTILRAMFPILFNIMFFMIGGTSHPASVWISYAWIHIAYFIMIATPLFSKKTQSNMIFQYTTGQISALYFGVEFILGLLFILIRAKGVKGTIIFQMIPFCVFLFVFLWNMLHNEHTAENEQKRAGEISFIKTAAAKAKGLINYTTDADLQKKIEKVYDTIHASPTKSSPAVKELESNVMMMLNELGMILEDNNIDEANKLVRKIQYTVEERNRMVSLSN